MATVKSKHVQNGHLWVTKLQMILSSLYFSVFYTMCIHYFHSIKTGLLISLKEVFEFEE